MSNGWTAMCQQRTSQPDPRMCSAAFLSRQGMSPYGLRRALVAHNISRALVLAFSRRESTTRWTEVCSSALVSQRHRGGKQCWLRRLFSPPAAVFSNSCACCSAAWQQCRSWRPCRCRPLGPIARSSSSCRSRPAARRTWPLASWPHRWARSWAPASTSRTGRRWGQHRHRCGRPLRPGWPHFPRDVGRVHAQPVALRESAL